ncbi:type II toxin-antitoxin system PemK/MazF family toxin [Candidatus Peregrinibacteria bacterium]|nr:type II toxin-antitoxin system PemK/MazF family toxin [Candidatus Peregrinibacteria bacterium]MCB9805452.1 type II toxin-antitoxin system PemK/MazF family toxin [Candidatus Peribacteria bacterium]
MQSGNRPCLIVSSDIFNKYAPTLVVIPFTSTIRKVFPSECIIEPSHTNGLTQQSRLLGSQIITLDKNFF